MCIRDRVNAEIRADRPRDEHRNVPIAQAKEMGAMALFGAVSYTHLDVYKRQSHPFPL